jgi:putative transposase
LSYSLEALYRAVGTARQNVHGYIERLSSRKCLEQQVLKLVSEIRRDHPEMGMREMYFKLRPDGMGRDAFERLCCSEGLKVKVRKNFTKTTDSRKTRFCGNKIADIDICRINQVWQSDITYYYIPDRFYYITMVQDTFSKVVLGRSASDSLRTENTSLPALKMAIRRRKREGHDIKGVIMHSDGGGQYYSDDYLKLTRSNGIINSMGKTCYENAMAESLNGVIKNKYLRYRNIKDLPDLQRELDRTVKLYNSSKPHSALNRETPEGFEKKWLNL